jgi:hypothetical protein
VRGCNHAFVNRFILLPKFSLAQVVVNGDSYLTASGSGSMLVRIPQPPSPPGLLGPDPGRLRCDFSIDLQTIIWWFSQQRPQQLTDAFRSRMGFAVQVCAAACSRGSVINQRNDASEAPNMAPGLSELPLCRITATASIPSDLIASIGTVKVSPFPVQVPSLTHRRTTLV